MDLVSMLVKTYPYAKCDGMKDDTILEWRNNCMVAIHSKVIVDVAIDVWILIVLDKLIVEEINLPLLSFMP